MANNPAPAPKGAMAPGGMTDIYGNPVVQNPIAPGGYTSEYGAPNQFAAGYDKAGYTWDPVKGTYVTKASSAPSQNALFGQLTGGLSGALGGGTGAGGGAMGGLTSLIPGGGGGSVAPLAMQDTSAADAANLNRTKDTVGKESAGAMRGLREQLGARGMLGSGLESRGTEQIAEAGLGQQGEIARQQQIDNSNRAQKTAETNYQGAITQRGQDISAAEAAATRNQTVLLSLLKVLGTGAGSGLSY